MYWVLIALGFSVFLLVFRNLLKSGLLSVLNERQSFLILTISIGLSWTLAIIGLLNYVFIMKNDTSNQFIISNVTDSLDFRSWTPVKNYNCEKIESFVRRTRIQDIKLTSSKHEDFIDRHGTTGCEPIIESISNNASLSRVTPELNRTKYELLFTIPFNQFSITNPLRTTYSFSYTNAYRTYEDNWVSKTIRHETHGYKFVLIFPNTSTWTKARITIQNCNSGRIHEQELITNINKNYLLIWQSKQNVTYSPGSIIKLEFLWPPLTGNKINFK